MSKTWTEGFDLETIPWDVLNSHYQSRRRRLAVNSGRRRSCGHRKWVQSCDICLRNYKRKEYRIANQNKQKEGK
jgi:hypothetical protein